jgi:hypothetical protein
MKKYKICLLNIILFSGCGIESKTYESTIPFRTLESEQTGINFSNILEYKTELNIIEYLYYYNGGGVSIGDINNDGLEDIYFTANLLPDRLYLNQGNMKFKDITFDAGLNIENSWSNGANMEDVNGDGFLDIYVAKVSPISSPKTHNLLYINNGDLTFSEMSSDFGLDFSGFSTQATFFDYDRDGDLDVYLLNHSIHSIRSYGTSEKRKESDNLSGDKFYENKINEIEGKFVEVTKEANIYDSPLGYGLAITTTDINNDGWLDLYIGNDFHENDYIYINNKDKTFKESIKKSIHHSSHFTMGIDVGDLDSDGKQDIFTTDMMPYDAKIFLKSGGEDSDKISRIKKEFGFEPQFSRNHFNLNRGNGSYSEIALQTQTYATDWSWSVLLQDFDSDGLNDIFITNGIAKRPNDLDYINYLSNVDFTKYNNSKQDEIKKKLIDEMPTLKISNILFRNLGDLKFENIKNSFIGKPSLSNGAAYSDLDKDGDLDIVINNWNSESTILENLSDKKNNYISIKLKGNKSYSITRGAKVNLYSNGKEWVKENIVTRGFLSSSTHNIFFGIGKTNKLDSIVVNWPDGYMQTEKNINSNQELTIKRNDLLSLNNQVKNNSSEYFLKILPFKHQENIFYDYERERLIPESLAHEGPVGIEADFNGDGTKDLFLGGARYQSPQIYQGSKGLNFSLIDIPDFRKDSKYEDVDAATIDIDNDGDLDLYVVSGGSDLMEFDENLMDRIYLNDGKGNFSRLPISLPMTNGSSVSVSDIDNDGFDDLFLGSRSIPGSYGLSPYSFILRNNTKNSFEILIKKRFGMVTDSQWADINGDNNVDLVIVGDWMPISVYLNTGKGGFDDATVDLGLSKTNGLWNSILIDDIDNDGQLDILAGNAGSNFKWKPTIEDPVKLYLDDFDQNLQLDPIIFYNFFGNYVPFSSKDKLDKQLPYLKKKFPKYVHFSNVDNIKTLTGKSEKEIMEIKYLYELRSTLFIKDGNKFISRPLPKEAQFSSIEDFYFVNDSVPKIIYVGNYHEYVNELGMSTDNPGGILSGWNSNSKEFTNSELLPLPLSLNSRQIIRINNDNFLILTNNNYIYILSKKESISETP